MNKHLPFVSFLVFSAIICPWALARGGKSTQTKPSVIRTTIADKKLGTSFGPFYDKQEGYYLLGNVDGLGKAMVAYLILRPDFKPLEDYGISREDVKEKTLPHLRGGRGINIGDTPRQVRQKIGQAAHKSRYNRKTKARTYIYQSKISLKVGDEMARDWDYTATYTFHHEKLWSIEYEARMHIPKGYDEMFNRLPPGEM